MTDHPGAYVRQIITEAGLSIGQAANAISMQRPHLNNVINAKANVTRTIAYKLDALLGTDTFAMARDLIDRQAAWDWEQDEPERLKVLDEIEHLEDIKEAIQKNRASKTVQAATPALPAPVAAPAPAPAPAPVAAPAPVSTPVRKGRIPIEKRIVEYATYRVDGFVSAYYFNTSLPTKFDTTIRSVCTVVKSHPLLDWIWANTTDDFVFTEAKGYGEQCLHFASLADAAKFATVFAQDGETVDLSPLKDQVARSVESKKVAAHKASLNRKDMPKRLRVVVRSNKVIDDLKAAGWGQINLPPMVRMPGGQQETFDTLHPLTGEKLAWTRNGYVTILKADPALDKLWQTSNEEFLIVAREDPKNRSYGPTTVTDAFVMFKSDDDAVMFKMMAL